MGHLSVYARQRIVYLRSTCSTIKEICLNLSQENLVVSRQSVSAFIKRYEATSSFADSPRSGRTPLLRLEHLDFIDYSLSQNNELTARDIQVELKDRFSKNISISTIKRVRFKLGWRYTGTRYSQLIRHVNKPLRQVFCMECLAREENFANVIFSDECSVAMGTSLRKCFRRIGQQRQLVGRPKHPQKVHVWAGISARGASQICIFTGIMDTEFYLNILDTHLLPFINNVFPDGHRFQQDNDPKHTSRATTAWFLENGVNYWPTPAESPDLNPIENMWAALKHYVYKTAKPRNMEDLVSAIKSFWETVTPELCQKYISHMHKVMPVVVAREGAASGY